MGADMFTASIAVPASRTEPVDFTLGRRLLGQIKDANQFHFEDPEAALGELLNDFDPGFHLNAKGQPTLEAAKQAGKAVIDALEEALASRETTSIIVAGYTIHISGGLSAGDAPTEAAVAIRNAYKLPDSVLLAMGFIPDFKQPLSEKNGHKSGLTDTDVVDAIALGLGTKPEWSGADTLEWIADTIGKVRTHPGDAVPAEYLRDFTERYEFNPLNSNFLIKYVAEEADGEDAENDE